MTSRLPRAVLVSDEPIELYGRANTEALARIVQHYPAGNLTIVQTQGVLPEADRRITHYQKYQLSAVPWDRLLRTRMSLPARILKVAHHRLTWRSFSASLRAHGPEVVIAFVGGTGWVLALRAAEQLKLPLHLIIHDGPAHYYLTDPVAGPFLTREFKRACRRATSRWSVCAALDQHIEQMTGVAGQVLPPLQRAEDEPVHSPVLKAPANQAVYFGGLSSISITSMLNDVGRQLNELGGMLHAHGGVSPDVAISEPWKNRCFQHHGAFGDRNRFLEDCRHAYSFMFLPFSFEDENTRFSFPSKLADYTLVGLPILVQGPPSSPLGVWCAENPDAVLFVDERGPDALRSSINALIDSIDLRFRLAKGAIKAGQKDFAFTPNWHRFIDKMLVPIRD